MIRNKKYLTRWFGIIALLAVVIVIVIWLPQQSPESHDVVGVPTGEQRPDFQKVQMLFEKNDLSMEGLEFIELNYGKHGENVTAIYFEQYANGLKVYPATIYYYFEDQVYLRMSRQRIDDISVDTKPKLNKGEAEKIVENKLPAILRHEDDIKALISSINKYETELIYYVDYEGDGKTKTYYLAYLVEPFGIQSPNPKVVVDAIGGEILDDGIRYKF